MCVGAESAGESFTSRTNGWGSSKNLERRSRMRKSKQVRMHCVATRHDAHGLRKAFQWHHGGRSTAPSPLGSSPGAPTTHF